MSLNSLPYSEFEKKPDFMREYSGLLGDLSTLVEITDRHRISDMVEHFEFPAIALDLDIPAPVEMLTGEINKVDVDICVDESRDYTYLSVELKGANGCYFITRDQTSPQAGPTDTFFPFSNPEPLKADGEHLTVAGLDDREILKILLQLSASTRDIIVPDEKQVALLNAKTLLNFQDFLLESSFDQNNQTEHVFQTTDAVIFLTKNRGQLKDFTLRYIDTVHDRTLQMTQTFDESTKTIFESDELIEVNEEFGITHKRFWQKYLPTVGDIITIRKIVQIELDDLSALESAIDIDQLEVAAPDTPITAERFSEEHTAAVLRSLDYDHPLSREMINPTEE